MTRSRLAFRFGAVFRHEHALDGAPVVETQQVAHGAVDRIQNVARLAGASPCRFRPVAAATPSGSVGIAARSVNLLAINRGIKLVSAECRKFRPIRS